jgi:hypothetical protein
MVFEATQLSLDRRVALKLFPKGPGIAERMRHLRWPEHPHAVSLYAAGPCEHGYFVAMQLVRGQSLAALIASRALGREAMTRVLGDVSAALDAAHRAGIVHGAVGARSVLVDGDGQAFLSDFGLGSQNATAESDRSDFAALAQSAQSTLRRRPPARQLGGIVALAAAGAAAAIVLALAQGGPKGPPALLSGATPLGSALPAAAIASVDCSGSLPSGASEPCTVVQTRLDGRPVTATRSGVVRRWTVRGASGELALEVLRRHGAGLYMVARTQYLLVGGSGIHSLPADLPVRAGDLVGLAVAPGAAIGVRGEVRGAATARRFGPADVTVERFEQGVGIGSDQELQLRVEYLPGARWAPPGLLTGPAATRAPSGRELASVDLQQAGPPDASLAAVRAGGRISIDLLAAGRRVARLPVPDADPAGRPASFYTTRVRLGQTIVRLAWRNPKGLVSHDYAADHHSLTPLD